MLFGLASSGKLMGFVSFADMQTKRIRAEALLRLGFMALDGEGCSEGKPNVKEGTKWLRQAQKLGHEDATVALEDIERYSFFANGLP